MSGDQSGQLLTFLDNHTLLIVVVVAIWIIREREKGIEREPTPKSCARKEVGHPHGNGSRNAPATD